MPSDEIQLQAWDAELQRQRAELDHEATALNERASAFLEWSAETRRHFNELDALYHEQIREVKGINERYGRFRKTLEWATWAMFWGSGFLFRGFFIDTKVETLGVPFVTGFSFGGALGLALLMLYSRYVWRKSS
jgi:hypothetical protein